MKILVSNNDNSYLIEMKDKGHYGDVFAQINNNYYKINIYDKTRLIQDYDTEVLDINSYVPDPNLLIVDEITNEEIIKVIKACYEMDYFEYLKPCKINSSGEIEYIFSSRFLKFLMDNGLYNSINISDLIPIYNDEIN